MRLPEDKLKELISKSGFIKEKDLNQAVNTAKELNQELGDVLIFRGLINEDGLNQLFADYYQLPFVKLKHKSIPLDVLTLINEKTARYFKIIPLDLKDGCLTMGMSDPANLEALEFVKGKTGRKIKTVYVAEKELMRALGQYKKNIKFVLTKIIKDNLEKSQSLVGGDIGKAASDYPIIKIMDTIVEYAVAENASDIHIENLETETVIRFRIDGILQDILHFNQEIHPALTARIKILANLKIDEHRIPQDGRFKFKAGEETIAARVSVVPAFYGENVVLRLLHESARPQSLEELGLIGESLAKIKKNIHKSYGMILVTGPTGSGKTTTLYSILNMLNSTAVKICTIEDPIEYGIMRVNQIQVNPQAGLTFANGLRSLLRHDPNIIMVGEIRDQETADMAIHSSLTGHLVLSTLHTNDAAGAIPRLLDMGVAGYLVGSTVNVIIAQRLARRICRSCVQRVRPLPEILKWIKDELGKEVKIDFYHGKGCDECNQTGYRGRTGIFEVLEVDEEIRPLILKQPPAKEIRKMAIKRGMISLFEDGINKVGAGTTTIEELFRILQQ